MKETLIQYFKDNDFLAIGEGNPKIKQIKGIIGNTKPNPQKLFIAEGLWAFKKLIEFDVKIFSVVACAECIHTAEAFEALKAVTKKTNERNDVSLKTFEKISERDKPDGLLAIAKLPAHDIADFSPRDKAVILVLDGIEIPGNIGTMLRMADGAGLDAVFICNKKARLTHPKLIKGSMGAVLSVPIFEFDTVEACRQWFYDKKFNVYLADTRAKIHYFEEPFGLNSAIVMGSERYGISRSWYEGDNIMLSIPMLGSCDSLNVGVAATVLAYEASMKNRFGKK